MESLVDQYTHLLHTILSSCSYTHTQHTNKTHTQTLTHSQELVKLVEETQCQLSSSFSDTLQRQRRYCTYTAVFIILLTCMIGNIHRGKTHTLKCF